MHRIKIKQSEKTVMLLIVIITTIAYLTYLSFAFGASTASFSVDAYHSGSAGDVIDTASFESTNSATYQEGVNSDFETASYTANMGFLSVYGEEWGDVTINSVECSNNSIDFFPCESLDYGMNITHIRVNCTAEEGTVREVRFTLHNLPDNTNYIDGVKHTYRSGDLFLLNSSYIIQDSGDWNLTVSCYGSDQDRNETLWSLIWGWINATLLNPAGNTVVEKNKMFAFESKVSCIRGECGAVNATLDPLHCTEEYVCKNDTKNMCSNKTQQVCDLECRNETIEECFEVPFEDCRTETVCENVQADKPVIKFENLFIPDNAELFRKFIVSADVRCYSESCGSVIVGLDFSNKDGSLYTADENPVSNACLSEMEKSDVCSLSWLVNATGTPGTMAELYLSADATVENITEHFESEHVDVLIRERTIPRIAGVTQSVGDEIYNEGKRIGIKESSKFEFDTYFNEIQLENEKLNIKLYHTFDGSLPIKIKGNVDYDIDRNSSEKWELVNISIKLEEGIIPKFKLEVGDESNKDVFDFGKVIPLFDISDMIYSIEDRADSKMNIRLVKGTESIEIRGVQDQKEIIADIGQTNDTGITTDVAVANPMGIEEASITINKQNGVENILRCDDENFNLTSLSCSGWVKTIIPFFESEDSVTFTVTHFTAYAGGNITNNETGYLVIWDDNDDGMPNVSFPRNINQQIKFFADLRASQNGSRIIDGSCDISFDSVNFYSMDFNSTYDLYMYNRTFSTAGLYDFSVNCSHPAYPDISVSDSIIVQESSTKSGAVSTITGAVPFYTTSSNPQECSYLRGGDECTNSWLVNATGLIKIIHFFFVDYNMTSNKAYVSDNSSSTIQIAIDENDTQAPVIASASISKRVIYLSQSIGFFSAASDNVQVDSCWANLSLPGGSHIIINNTCDEQQLFTPSVLGRTNVTFMANDTSGRIGEGSSMYFQVVAPINFTVTTNSSSGKVETEMIMYHQSTAEEVHRNITNGTYSVKVPYVIYDITFKAFNDDIQLTLKDVNISRDNNKTMGIDKLSVPVPSYLVTYGLDSSYTFSNASLIIYYDDLAFTNEEYLEIFKCDDWNFSSESCDGKWNDITSSSVLNTNGNYFNYSSTSLSGFSIMQGLYCGDGTCNNGETCSSCAGDCGSCTNPPGGGGGGGSGGGSVQHPENCTPEWLCSTWGPCLITSTRNRKCYSLNNCFIDKPTETDSCIYVHPPKTTGRIVSDIINITEEEMKEKGAVEVFATQKEEVEEAEHFEERPLFGWSEISGDIVFITFLILISTILFMLLSRKEKPKVFIFVLRTKEEFEDYVMAFVINNMARKGLEIYSVTNPEALKGYLLVEAASRKDVELSVEGNQYALEILAETVEFSEVSYLFEEFRRKIIEEAEQITKTEIEEVKSKEAFVEKKPEEIRQVVLEKNKEPIVADSRVKEEERRIEELKREIDELKRGYSKKYETVVKSPEQAEEEIEEFEEPEPAQKVRLSEYAPKTWQTAKDAIKQETGKLVNARLESKIENLVHLKNMLHATKNNLKKEGFDVSQLDRTIRDLDRRIDNSVSRYNTLMNSWSEKHMMNSLISIAKESRDMLAEAKSLLESTQGLINEVKDKQKEMKDNY